MSESDFTNHYVCTSVEARCLAFKHHRFWLSSCGCRERRGHCARSRMDVCLSFRGDIPASGSGMREITLTDVLSLFDEATEKRLVARPYRNESQPAVTDGICFCCDDCCEYFTKSDSMACEKGAYIESTDMDSCNFCGDCIGSCYFHARKMEGGELTVERKICYGCGLCAEICPQKCIEMALR